MKTHVSLGMKYPFRVRFVVVLKERKGEESIINTTDNLEFTVHKTFVLPVRYGERDVGSMTKHFIYERLRERHLGLI